MRYQKQNSYCRDAILLHVASNALAYISGMVTAAIIFTLTNCGRTETSKPSNSLRPLEHGWYERSDSKAQGRMVSDHNMAIGETSVRCFCDGETLVEDLPNGVFRVAKTEYGYRDEVGRKFKSGKVNCANCMD